jgi:hypothetical protein
MIETESFKLAVNGVNGMDENPFISHILQHVYSACHLEHLHFTLKGIPQSCMLLNNCLAADTLSHMKLNSHYSFDSLIKGLKRSPDLKQFTLPWPASMGEGSDQLTPPNRFHDAANGVTLIRRSFSRNRTIYPFDRKKIDST